MNKITDLHYIRDAALKAVDPESAVRKFIQLNIGEHWGPNRLHTGETIWEPSKGKRVFFLAIGKAALPMVHVASFSL